MKFVFIPGVGFQKDLSKYEKFLDNFRKDFNCSVEIFNWDHTYQNERHHISNDDLSYNHMRAWFSEVLLDLQQAIYRAHEMDIPEADLYIGHSAGSIIALAKAKDKHCIMMGSPVHLIDMDQIGKKSFLSNCSSTKTKVLNIVHRKDIIAYPIDRKNVENYYISSPFYKMSAYSPISAHGSYWTNKDCYKASSKQLKDWGF